MSGQQEAALKRSGMLDAEGTWSILKDVAVVSVSFMIFFTAYGGTVNLQSSINAEEGLGTESLAAVFIGFVLSSLFLAPVLIRWLGSKWTMCVAFLTFAPYIGFQMYPTFYTLIPTGFFMGLGAGPCWCAKCTYLALAAEAHSELSNIPAGSLLQRFLGIFFMFYQLSEIWGNLISSLVLSSGDNKAAVTNVSERMIPELCGANFLPSLYAHDTLPPQPAEKIRMIAGIYLAIMLGSTILMAVGLDSMKKFEASRKSTASAISLLIVTFKQLADPVQLLILPLNIFLGLYQSFFMAVFTASFVACAVGTGTVGFVMMVYGVSDAIGCVITGILRFGRMPLYITAMILHGGLLLSLLVWRPHAGEHPYMFMIAILWGLCDSVWMVQINGGKSTTHPQYVNSNDESNQKIPSIQQAKQVLKFYFMEEELRIQGPAVPATHVGLHQLEWQAPLDQRLVRSVTADYGVLFRGNEAAAFANFRLWEAAGFIITYLLAPYIRTRYMVYLLLCFLIVGMICYFVVEYRQDHQLRRPTESQAKVPGKMIAVEDRGRALQTVVGTRLRIPEQKRR